MNVTLDGPSIITGAAGTIGRSIALALATAGSHSLLLVDRSLPGLTSTRAALLSSLPTTPLRIILHVADLSRVPDCAGVVPAAVEAFGGVRYLVNCAGTPGGFRSALEQDVETFDEVMGVNVRAAWVLQRDAVGVMLGGEERGGERGSIVNIGSTLSHVGQQRLSAYVTSKHAILGLTRADALDYAARGVRINCVCPGLVSSDLGAGIPEEVREKELAPVLAKTPLGRMGRGEEVAGVVVFLLSARAGFVVGAAWDVDGGFGAG